VGNLDWNLTETSQFMTDLFYLLVVNLGFHALSGQSRFANTWPLINRWPIDCAYDLSILTGPSALKDGCLGFCGFCLLLFSYTLLVRSTPIGTLLNGRRHPFLK
jgi:hypothetical protein